ncbi:hypothetical protein [Sphaerisporangium aureirubrum]|uniref:Uncharacterized protein n=1 Tax=Sphaerisporangium aureirubrum TaxID=1544736 RepID=A0ABW1NBS0_9ACTN
MLNTPGAAGIVNSSIEFALGLTADLFDAQPWERPRERAGGEGCGRVRRWPALLTLTRVFEGG